MARKPIQDLGELQEIIMDTLWKLGEATAREVQERLGKKKKLAYTSVLTALQRLEKAGWIKHRQHGKAYIYKPVLTKEEEQKRSLTQILKRVFQGDSRLLLQHLVQSEEISIRDLAALQKIIDDARKERARV